MTCHENSYRISHFVPHATRFNPVSALHPTLLYSLARSDDISPIRCCLFNFFVIAIQFSYDTRPAEGLPVRRLVINSLHTRLHSDCPLFLNQHPGAAIYDPWSTLL